MPKYEVRYRDAEGQPLTAVVEADDFEIKEPDDQYVFRIGRRPVAMFDKPISVIPIDEPPPVTLVTEQVFERERDFPETL